MNKLKSFTLVMALALCGSAMTLAGPGAAWAQSNKPRAASKKAAKADKRPIKTLVFGEGSDIEGDIPGPLLEDVSGRGDTSHGNLIRIRKNFLAEIHKSAERL